MQTGQQNHEETLLDRAAEGDEGAFAVLYRRYQGQIQAFCARMLNGNGDSEDATQQVFMEAWRSLHRFERRSLFSTWLTRIAIHTCLSLLRKTNKIKLHREDSRVHPDRYTEFLWRDSEPGLEQKFHQRAQRKAVDEILNRLSEKKKTVIMMSDVQGMTAPEIAGALQIPDATVRTRLFHARREFIHAIHSNSHYKELLGD
ncbi:MAG: RNA polymerase sigma factor [Myxococcaceae bacterium]|nr:RNA polymerase sigma factor [Myxococcaceae bacterium]MBH2006727.1 RNA polymerase sigma factor [Myxococcaceae bacterium]